MSLFDEIINEIDRTQCDPGTSEIMLSLESYLSMDVERRKQMYRAFYKFEATGSLPGNSFAIREHA